MKKVLITLFTLSLFACNSGEPLPRRKDDLMLEKIDSLKARAQGTINKIDSIKEPQQIWELYPSDGGYYKIKSIDAYGCNCNWMLTVDNQEIIVCGTYTLKRIK